MNVWITWVGERIEITADERLYIQILEDIERLSEEYYESEFYENELRKYKS